MEDKLILILQEIGIYIFVTFIAVILNYIRDSINTSGTTSFKESAEIFIVILLIVFIWYRC